jgi:hypothetical protein
VTNTGYILLIAMIVLAIWDAYAQATGGIKMTESWFIRQVACNHPFFILSIGYLLGHFFSGMMPE